MALWRAANSSAQMPAASASSNSPSVERRCIKAAVLPALARAGLDHFHLVTSLIQPTCPRLHGRFRVTHLDHFGWIELGICRPDCEWACRIVFNHAGILPRGRVYLQSAPRNHEEAVGNEFRWQVRATGSAVLVSSIPAQLGATKEATISYGGGV